MLFLHENFVFLFWVCLGFFFYKNETDYKNDIKNTLRGIKWLIEKNNQRYNFDCIHIPQTFAKIDA